MNENCELGLVGLGVMGRNLLLNMADHGYVVAGYNRSVEKVAALRGVRPNIHAYEDIAEFVAALKRPRVVMLLVSAGPPVDAVISRLLPHLEAGDCIIDGGNSFFKDTEQRQQLLVKQGIDYLGIGVSGGEEGARHGPCMMPGGPRPAWERIRPLFESIAAQANSESCVRYMGPGSAGHFVKMVHNGIEYGVMGLISETYGFMKRGLGLSNDELGDVFEQWNQTELRSYLVEITAKIFRADDAKTGGRLLDVISDVARQKGTGLWTSQTAMALHTPVPCIDIAVTMRDLSTLKAERVAASKLYNVDLPELGITTVEGIAQLRGALFAGMMMTFAQGMALLHVASKTYGYELDLEAIARIWRGGCIIRAALLDSIAAAFHAQPELPNLLLDPAVAAELVSRVGELRRIVCLAANAGIPVPGFMAALSYIDSYRSARLPANLVEAQRDFFGAHGYERIDEAGTFHTEWSDD